jgi:lipopolysaccharide transport system permease protein
MTDRVVTTIRPDRGWLQVDINAVWRYRDLLWCFVLRDVKIRYRQTILGPLWLGIQPLAMTGILTVIIHGMAGIKTDGHQPILFYFSAIILWQYFSQAVLAISQVFIVNEYLFAKVYFPRIVVPASIVIANAVGLLIQVGLFVIVAGVLLILGQFHPSFSRLWLLPVTLVLLMAVTLGTGLIVASSTAKYRDIANAMPFILQAGLFLTPVLYPLSAVPQNSRLWLAIFNPLAIMCESWRSAALGGDAVSLLQLAVSAASALTILAVGAILFHRVERTATDTI